MKTVFRYSLRCLLGIAVFALAVSSCSNDFKLNASGDPVAVVYCLLNPDADAQYIRLGRTFLTDPNDPKKPPVTDSTVWNMAVTVYLEEWQNGSPSKIITFEPATSPVKDTGYFPSDNLRLFKADFKPLRMTTYHLYVHFPDDNRIVSGETNVPDRPIVFDPLDIPGRKINLQTGVQLTTRWAPGAGQGIFQGSFIFHFQEEINSSMESKRIEFTMLPILGLGSAVEMTDILSGNRFLEEMVRKIPVAEGIVRTVTGMQFRLFKGGEELALMVSPDLQQTTISNNLSQYTNLVNGMGVFSSIQLVSVNNLQLSNTTLNELANSELTRNLGFKDIHGGGPDPKTQEKNE